MPKHARLNYISGWCPVQGDRDTCWLQVTLPTATVVTAIASQGAGNGYHWPLDFAVKYGMEVTSLVEYKDKDGSLKVFKNEMWQTGNESL